MTITFAAWADELEALTVTGVTRAYTQGQPSSLNTADLPAMWVDMPASTAEPSTASYAFDVTKVLNLVVALEPIAQNRRPTNFDAVLVMLDSIEAALETYGGVSGSNRGISWESKFVFLTVNATDFFAVTTTITRTLT